MKTIGLIGGMSWESSSVYYQLINKYTTEKMGGFHSAKSILLSVDFAEVEAFQRQDNWNQLERLMVDAAKKLEVAGADFIVMCTNTMHKCAPAITENTSILFLHIAHATGVELQNRSFRKVALLGTKFTMQMGF